MQGTEFRSTDRSPFALGIRGRCPRCGEGRLFRGYLALADRCEVCGLDYAFADPADGPAFFGMAIGSIPALTVGLWLELTFSAPLWVHFFTTFPLILLGSLAVLRPAKGWLVCSQYMHKAEEARFEAARKQASAAPEPETRQGTGSGG